MRCTINQLIPLIQISFKNTIKYTLTLHNRRSIRLLIFLKNSAKLEYSLVLHRILKNVFYLLN